MVAACALTVIEEDQSIIRGVVTPAIAFQRTNLIQRLEREGVSFTVVDAPHVVS